MCSVFISCPCLYQQLYLTIFSQRRQKINKLLTDVVHRTQICTRHNLVSKHHTTLAIESLTCSRSVVCSHQLSFVLALSSRLELINPMSPVGNLKVYCSHQLVLISLAWLSRISLANARIWLSHSISLREVLNLGLIKFQ